MDRIQNKITGSESARLLKMEDTPWKNYRPNNMLLLLFQSYSSSTRNRIEIQTDQLQVLFLQVQLGW
jgi:hypothetical protein